jgi:hypothetical protein
MYHTEVSPNPTNGNADIHESGALPFLSLPRSFAASSRLYAGLTNEGCLKVAEGKSHWGGRTRPIDACFPCRLPYELSRLPSTCLLAYLLIPPFVSREVFTTPLLSAMICAAATEPATPLSTPD